MARPDKVASRYGKAIFDAYKGENLQQIVRELELFSRTLEQHESLKRLLSSDILKNGKSRGVVEDVAEKLSISAPTQRVLVVIMHAKRIDHLSSIVVKLKNLLLEAANIAPMEVTAASVLNQEQQRRIEEKFQKILGRKVEASYTVDPKLIGGLKVKAGSRTFDGSLAGWLTTFEEKLAGGSV